MKPAIASTVLSLILTTCAHMTVIEMSFSPGDRFYYEANNYLNFRVLGRGQTTIVLLHGFGASGQTWNDVIPYLNQDQRRYIVFDLIGSGFSSKPTVADYSMPANASAIIKFIADNKLKDYVIVGHSFGGGVALLTAIKSIDRATNTPKALILLDAAAYNTELPFFVDTLRIPVVGKLILALTSTEFQARYTLERIYFDKSKVSDEKVARYAFFMRLPGHDVALLQTAKRIIPEDFEKFVSTYRKLYTPTLILWGKNDPAIPIENGVRLARELPNASLHIIERCGHNIQEECPARVADEINNFVSSISD